MGSLELYQKQFPEEDAAEPQRTIPWECPSICQIRKCIDNQFKCVPTNDSNAGCTGCREGELIKFYENCTGCNLCTDQGGDNIDTQYKCEEFKPADPCVVAVETNGRCFLKNKCEVENPNPGVGVWPNECVYLLDGKIISGEEVNESNRDNVKATCLGVKCNLLGKITTQKLIVERAKYVVWAFVLSLESKDTAIFRTQEIPIVK